MGIIAHKAHSKATAWGNKCNQRKVMPISKQGEVRAQAPPSTNTCDTSSTNSISDNCGTSSTSVPLLLSLRNLQPMRLLGRQTTLGPTPQHFCPPSPIDRTGLNGHWPQRPLASPAAAWRLRAIKHSCKIRVVTDYALNHCPQNRAKAQESTTHQEPTDHRIALPLWRSKMSSCLEAGPDGKRGRWRSW